MDRRSMNEEEILAVSSNSLIMGKIFKLLNARDLSSCARVCSIWYKFATDEKKSRRDITWVFSVGPCPDTRFEQRNVKSCALLDHHEVENHTFNQMENLREQPVFFTAFMTRCLFEKMQKFFPSFGDSEPSAKRPKSCQGVSRRKYLNSVMDLLKSYLPENCKMTFTITTGVIGYKEDFSPLEVESGPAIAGYFIPEIPGVQVRHHPITGRNRSLAEFVSKDAQVKCLLLFLTSRGGSIVNKLIRSCCPEGEEINMAIGGAIVERTESLLGSATAFCGHNVEASSVIINPLDKEKEIAAKLEVFKDGDLHKNKCIAYMFACVGRGFQLHAKRNLESSIFSMMYPNIPIIGVFGDGEIGVNYIPSGFLARRNLKVGKFKSSKKFLHSYTTIFVLISFKK